ncbi:2-keto-4-pentenoate hydratase [Xylanimonas allomyrinae]|uniref:2-keto-4-pentenoate hydratase n=1 Tax=Xylanimonas allomyrinae TaxID=2509459 RepID=A0A4P6EJI0_9MICO|nr:fumarylacetoacetate hydrolase family protein [Xylanimonas allomyrinae]QAY62206.1 2-keto-4-pentenoate hydratase [Xylanimonas allomyrinae]
MSTSAELRRSIADRLLAAYESRQPIDPISSDAKLTAADAYAIQLDQVTSWTGAGRTVAGYKVGLTSRAMQRQLGVTQPDFGHVMRDQVHLDHEPLDRARYIQPKVEPEIAFVLGSDLAGPGVNVAQALRAVDFVLPALELIDSRITDWKIGYVDTVADNASGAGVVLGSRPVRVDALDLALSGCVLEVGGLVAATGAGGAVLGSPVNALVWLANTLGERGVTFRAGDVVLSGSVTAAVTVEAGTVARARFGGIGQVTTVFG